MAIKIAFLLLLTAHFLFGLYKHRLSVQQRRQPLPDNVRDVFDTDEYARWQAYQIKTDRARQWRSAASFVLLFVLLSINAHAWISGFLPDDPFWGGFLLLLIDALIALPVQVYFDNLINLKIENKYGFNRMDRKTFVTDEVKQFAVQLVITGVLLLLFVKLHQWLGIWSFVALFIALAGLVVLISTFSMTLSKLFNKFVPLEEGTLRTQLEELFHKYGYTVRNIYVVDASKRTTKPNAYCFGLGKKKEIALEDNLVNRYTEDEITAVFAHELAHFHHRDTMKMALMNTAQTLPIALMLILLVSAPSIFQAFGFAGLHYGMAMILMEVLAAPLSTLAMIPISKAMRAYEYRADAFAASNGYGKDIISALKQMNRDHLSDLNPHPLIVKWEYTHPTLSQRIAHIERQG